MNWKILAALAVLISLLVGAGCISASHDDPVSVPEPTQTHVAKPKYQVGDIVQPDRSDESYIEGSAFMIVGADKTHYTVEGVIWEDAWQILPGYSGTYTHASVEQAFPALEGRVNPRNVKTYAPTPAQDTRTIGEANAETKAAQYLRYSAFSRTGLIEQLEFEGFSRAEAVYGTDAVGADWNEQAAKKAEQYLKYSAFSRSSLIDQLEFEGFTRAQAEYGAKAVGY